MEVKNLKAYLANINMTIKKFCEIIDCDDKYLSRIIHEKVTPGKRLARDVYHATNGVITLKTRKKKSELQENLSI